MKRILASLGILVASGTFAHAGVDFCNQFKHPIFVAVAYDSGGGDMVSTGWEKAESGEARDEAKPVPGVVDPSKDPKGHGGDVPVDDE